MSGTADEDFDWIDDEVTLTKGDLDYLLWFAKRGDKVLQRRHWWSWRRGECCWDSPEVAEGCPSCQLFQRMRSLVPEEERQ